MLTSHHTLPPFPEDIKTAPLVSVSWAKLEADDGPEREAVFKACKDLGFFYLDLLGSELGEQLVRDAEALNKVQEQFWALPNDVKDTYGLKVLDPFFAYRFTEIHEKDANGDPVRIQNYNIKKDDILGQHGPRLACHDLILQSQETFRSFVTHGRMIIDKLLELLNTHLRLPPGTLQNLHRNNEPSGDHVRFNHAPPQPYNEIVAKRGEHTDFGSLTILFNWLGGLQIREQAEGGEWVYVKPVPGSCVVNLGDAMVRFTAGILRSNIHRVVPAPGAQSACARNSLVFFTRPENAVILRRLEGGLVDLQPATDEGEEITAAEWWLKRGTGVMPGIFTSKGFEKFTVEPLDRGGIPVGYANA